MSYIPTTVSKKNSIFVAQNLINFYIILPQQNKTTYAIFWVPTMTNFDVILIKISFFTFLVPILTNIDITFYKLRLY